MYGLYSYIEASETARDTRTRDDTLISMSGMTFYSLSGVGVMLLTVVVSGNSSPSPVCSSYPCFPDRTVYRLDGLWQFVVLHDVDDPSKLDPGQVKGPRITSGFDTRLVSLSVYQSVRTFVCLLA